MTLSLSLRRHTAAALASSLIIAVGSVAASAAPNSDVYRASATGPDAAPISEQLVVVHAPEPGRAVAPVLVLRTVFRRTTKRTDIVEAPQLGRGRM
jgi:hypothetical protein